MRHGELRDVRHYHFLNSTCDIGHPPIKGPKRAFAQKRSIGGCKDVLVEIERKPQLRTGVRGI